jgi:hypothetical protein
VGDSHLQRAGFHSLLEAQHLYVLLTAGGAAKMPVCTCLVDWAAWPAVPLVFALLSRCAGWHVSVLRKVGLPELAP